MAAATMIRRGIPSANEWSAKVSKFEEREKITNWSEVDGGRSPTQGVGHSASVLAQLLVGEGGDQQAAPHHRTVLGLEHRVV